MGLIQHAHTNSLTLSSRPQVHLSTGTKKLVAATALGAVSLLFLARHFQRRKRHKKSQSQQWEQASFQFPPPLLAEQGEELRPVRRSLPSATLRPHLFINFPVSLYLFLFCVIISSMFFLLAPSVLTFPLQSLPLSLFFSPLTATVKLTARSALLTANCQGLGERCPQFPPPSHPALPSLSPI